MSQNLKSKRRKNIGLLLFLGAFAIIGGLLYFEQIGVIYLLSTIGLVVLLLLVAFTDLEKTDFQTEIVEEKGFKPQTQDFPAQEADLLIDAKKSGEIKTAKASG